MEGFDIKRYVSGYTVIRWALGVVPKSLFGDNPVRYVLRTTKEGIAVFSLLEMRMASPIDLATALGFQNPDAETRIIQNPVAELEGNAYRFYSKENRQPFLYVTTTDVVDTEFRGFGYGLYGFNAFFTSSFGDFENHQMARAYEDFALTFYRQLVLHQDEAFYGVVMVDGIAKTLCGIKPSPEGGQG